MDKKRELLYKLAPELNNRLGPIAIWEFTASFMSDGWWLARVDYILEGQLPAKHMKGLLIDGYYSGDKCIISSTRIMNPRVFLERRSIAILRAGIIQLTIEAPPIDEERTA
jgi:hypothetical protein